MKRPGFCFLGGDEERAVGRLSVAKPLLFIARGEADARFYGEAEAVFFFTAFLILWMHH